MSFANWLASTSLAIRYALALGVVIISVVCGAMVKLAFIRRRQKRLRELKEEGNLRISHPLAISSSTQILEPLGSRDWHPDYRANPAGPGAEEDWIQGTPYTVASDDDYFGDWRQPSFGESMLEMQPLRQTTSIQEVSLEISRSLHNYPPKAEEGDFFGSKALESGFYGGVFQVPASPDPKVPRNPLRGPNFGHSSSGAQSAAGGAARTSAATVSPLLPALDSPGGSLSASRQISPALSMLSGTENTSQGVSSANRYSWESTRSSLGLKVVCADEKRDSRSGNDTEDTSNSAMKTMQLIRSPYKPLYSALHPSTPLGYNQADREPSYFSNVGTSFHDNSTPFQGSFRPNSPSTQGRGRQLVPTYRALRSPGPPPIVPEISPPLPSMDRKPHHVQALRDKGLRQIKRSDETTLRHGDFNSQETIQQEISTNSFVHAPTSLQNTAKLASLGKAKGDSVGTSRKNTDEGNRAFDDWGSDIFHQIEDSISNVQARRVSRMRALAPYDTRPESWDSDQRDSLTSIYSQSDDVQDEEIKPERLRPLTISKTHVPLPTSEAAANSPIDPVQYNVASIGMNAAYAPNLSMSADDLPLLASLQGSAWLPMSKERQSRLPQLNMQSSAMMRSHSEPRSPVSPPPLIGSFEEYRWLTASPRFESKSNELAFVPHRASSEDQLDRSLLPSRHQFSFTNGNHADLESSAVRGRTIGAARRMFPSKVPLHRAVPSFPLPPPSPELKESISRLQRDGYDRAMRQQHGSLATMHAAAGDLEREALSHAQRGQTARDILYV